MLNKINKTHFFNIFCFILTATYLFLFFRDITPFWFNPEWTTDDALQQTYPFHQILIPDLFKGDLITEVMLGYLAPVHYWLSYFFTVLTGDPIMMGHWVMLIQISVLSLFLFLLIYKLSAFGPACLGLLWIYHTRTFMQRITGGLPRGWSAPLIVAFLYFLVKKNHKAVLLVLFIGCLLHPPSTLICATTYGLYLFFGVVVQKTRKEFLKPLIVLIILSPVYVFTVFKVVERPEHIGQMITYEKALKDPAMIRPYGRFPFVPHLEISKEIRMYAFQPFQHRLAKVSRFAKDYAPYIFLSLFFILLIYNFFRKKRILTPVLCAYVFSIIPIYFLSRIFAFKLYVPDRHLQQPMAIFWVVSFIVLIWQAFANQDNKSYEDKKDLVSYKLIFAYFILFCLIYFGNGHGFYGSLNFNYSLYKKGKVFVWLEKNTNKEALIAGHPQFIDGVMLFAKRKGYATYETAHPFYPKYFKEVLRRHTISLKAHYAKDLKEVYELLEPEKIDYFVFNKTRFYPDQLKKARYFEPLKTLNEELTSRDYMDYAYKQLPKDLNLKNHPYLIFRDEQSAIIDVKKLGDWLQVIN